MSYEGYIQIRMDFTNPSWWTNDWVYVTDDVVSAQWGRGRKSWTDEPTPNSATVVLCNESRKYDPANTQGPYYPFPTRPKIEIRVRSTTANSWVTKFAGRATIPRTEYGPEGGAQAVIEAVDIMGDLNFGVREIPEEFLGELDGDLVWYAWDGPQVRSDGLVNELFRNGPSAYTSTNEIDGPNISNRTTSNERWADLNRYDSITYPLDPDMFNSSNGGFFFINEIYAWDLRHKTLLTSGTWTIAGDPLNRDPEIYGYFTAADNNPGTALRFNWIYGAARDYDGVIIGAAAKQFTVGTVGDILQKETIVMLTVGDYRATLKMIDKSNWTVRSYSLGFVGLNNGKEIPVALLAGPKSGNHIKINNTHDPGRWYVRRTILGLGGCSPSDANLLAGKLALNKGWTPRGIKDRFEWIRVRAQLPNNRFANGLVDGLYTAPMVSDSNALALAQNLVRTARGRLYVDHDGEIRAESRATAIARATDIKATFTDAPTGGVRYRAGTGNPIMDGNRFFNIVETTSAWGRSESWGRASSFAANGEVRTSVSLDLFDQAKIAGWVASFFNCQADPEPFIESIQLKPEGDPGAMAEIHWREIGDAIQVRRKPLNEGSALNKVHIIEGQDYHFDSETGFTVDFWLSPQKIWSLGAFP